MLMRMFAATTLVSVLVVTAVLQLLAAKTQLHHTSASLDIIAACIFVFMPTLTCRLK